MLYTFSKFQIILFAATFCFSILNAQTNSNLQTSAQYNTKRNYVFVNACIGGGDFPFKGLGLNLSRQFFNGKTMAGIGAHYIGDTGDGSSIGGFDPIQIFPLMVDIRQTFMESPNGRFSTQLIADAGYVIRINGHNSNSEGSYEYQNGWAINPGISFRLNVFKNMGVMLDITWLHLISSREWLVPVEKKDHIHWDVGLVRMNVFF
jgi:hypothetical protein